MKNNIRIGIVGATGYVGAELVRALSRHPVFELTTLVSKTYAGTLYSDIYPVFKGKADIVCSELDANELSKQCDAVITALPHGVSSRVVPELLKNGLRVIDHSGDFRYKDVSVYERAYKLVHPCPELLAEAVYGLPELYRDKIAKTRLAANPGCYPTCSILAIFPLLKYSLVDPGSIIVNAVSGISGAGKTPGDKFTFCEASDSFRAYSVTGHRHTSEIEKILSEKLPGNISVTFTPHLAPMKRGMLATVYANISADANVDKIHSCFEKEYADEYFVRVLPKGRAPETIHVEQTNFADIGIHVDEHTGRAIILSAIDNLGKGASLQAVQTLNVMFGLDEKTGLKDMGSFL